MKEHQTSMDMIDKSQNTVIISSDCGHGLEHQGVVIPTKKCPKCGRELPTTEYYANCHNKDGLQDKCKDCQREWNREYVRRKRKEKQIGSVKNEDKVETKQVIIEEKEHAMTKVYSEPDLAKFTPRQLMSELKARGWRWEYMLEPQRKVYFDKI